MEASVGTRGTAKKATELGIGTPSFISEDSVLAVHFIEGDSFTQCLLMTAHFLKMAGRDHAYIHVDLKNPSAFQYDQYGNFIVLDRGHDRIIKLYPINGQMRVLVGDTQELSRPTQLSYDPVLKRYFVLEESGRILLWNGPGHSELIQVVDKDTGPEMVRGDYLRSEEQTTSALAYSPEIGLLTASAQRHPYGSSWRTHEHSTQRNSEFCVSHGRVFDPGAACGWELRSHAGGQDSGDLQRGWAHDLEDQNRRAEAELRV